MDWSNASSEVEYHGVYAQRVGDEGCSVATIIEMAALTRLGGQHGLAFGTLHAEAPMKALIARAAPATC